VAAAQAKSKSAAAKKTPSKKGGKKEDAGANAADDLPESRVNLLKKILDRKTKEKRQLEIELEKTNKAVEKLDKEAEELLGSAAVAGEDQVIVIIVIVVVIGVAIIVVVVVTIVVVVVAIIVVVTIKNGSGRICR
jgi:Flp pilus assembly protein TadB